MLNFLCIKKLRKKHKEDFYKRSPSYDHNERLESRNYNVDFVTHKTGMTSSSSSDSEVYDNVEETSNFDDGIILSGPEKGFTFDDSGMQFVNNPTIDVLNPKNDWE